MKREALVSYFLSCFPSIFFRKSASLLNYFVKLATGVDIISSKHLRTGAPDLKKYNAFD